MSSIARSFAAMRTKCQLNSCRISVLSRTGASYTSSQANAPSLMCSLHRSFRTMTCGQPRPEHEGKSVDLSGWVHNVRIMGDGLVFIALRDAYGITQVVVEAGAADSREHWQSQLLAVATSLKQEAVVHVTGTIRKRPEALVNAKLATGAIEVQAAGLRVLSQPSKALPIVPGAMGSAEAGQGASSSASGSTAQSSMVSEEVRLAARHIDLRRDVLQRNIRFRSLVAHAIRSHLLTACAPAFVEVETPSLVRSSPEGAREFLVPTRHKGKWYALAQSPQQFKQLLMIGGFDRYFQLARCFRDESGRADRQPEFTQVDLEMAFATAIDVQETVEGMLKAVFQAANSAACGEHSNGLPSYDFGHMSPPLLRWRVPSLPLPRLTYAHALCVYGSDKPDRRVGMPLHDVTSQAAGWDGSLPPMAKFKQAIEWAKASKASAAAHPRLRVPDNCSWMPESGDSDLSALADGAWAVRACVARQLGAQLSRAEGEAVIAELTKAMAAKHADASGRGPELVLARVGPDGVSFKDSVLAKGLSPAQQAAMIAALQARAGDMVLCVWGTGMAAAQAAGTARLALADVCRLVGLTNQLEPHNTTVRLGPLDTIAHALGSALASALPARKGGATGGTGHGKQPKKGSVSSAPTAAGSSSGPAQQPDPAVDDVSMDLFWVTGFPLFEHAEGTADRLSSVHHPFTAAVPEDQPALALAASSRDMPTLLSLRGQHYDLVANGVELGGGSVRMHDAALQRKVLEEVLGLRPAEQHGFGMLLAALDSGAPPHAGIALGLDRLLSMLAGPAAATSVRDVIAFPKSATGTDLLTGSPAEATADQLAEYHVAVSPTAPQRAK